MTDSVLEGANAAESVRKLFNPSSDSNTENVEHVQSLFREISQLCVSREGHQDELIEGGYTGLQGLSLVSK